MSGKIGKSGMDSVNGKNRTGGGLTHLQKGKGHKNWFSVDKTFDVVNLVLMVVMLLVFAWPLWFVVIASLSEPGAVYRGEVILFPKGITLESYKAILE